MSVWLTLAAIVVGTWNGNWFPSGRAEHRAHPDVETATVVAAAQMLRSGLDRMDPAGTNDVILCLHEMRGPRVASNLVARIGRRGLRVVSVSGYRRRDRFDMQQDVIATTLPVAKKGWSVFSPRGRETPPRGFAYADVVTDPATTSRVYAVHLKSNYGASRNKEAARLNRCKRTHSIADVLADAAARPRATAPVVIAGDFNADRWKREFAAETIFRDLETAGFTDLLALLPEGRRGTHPNRTYGDSALDYIMVRGFSPEGLPHLQPNEGLSDHFALFAPLSAVQNTPLCAR